MTRFGKRLAPAANSATQMPQTFPASLQLAQGPERSCLVTAIDPESALFLSDAPLATGTPVTAFIEEIGRVDGVAGDAIEGGFWVNFTFAEGRQQRFIKHLRWLIRRDAGLADAARRHTRYEPRDAAARFSLPSGREHSCEVIDISLSGTALRSLVKPSIGSPVTVGRMKGRVVRHFEDGFAVEFLAPLERSDLDSVLR